MKDTPVELELESGYFFAFAFSDYLGKLKAKDLIREAKQIHPWRGAGCQGPQDAQCLRTLVFLRDG